MDTFLQKIAKHLITEFKTELSDITVVLPNKRAALFLKRSLSKLISDPIWLPHIIGTEELIEQLSEAEIIDNTTQLFELYSVYRKNTKDYESFDEFAKWGQILLHDFNEIDRYLVPTDQLFKHINEARAIEVWNVGEGEVTEFQQQYLKFWKQLGELYTLFSKHLTENNLAYQGLAYRKVSENLKANPEEFIASKIDSKKLIFAGFNALNKAEVQIISVLKKQKKCEVIFDADHYYLDDNIQESGLFLREWKKKDVFSPFNYISEKFKNSSKNIDVLGVPQNIGQAKYLTNILSEINPQEFTETAVVLADENLLVPVLQSLPQSIDNINVTMGYPLKNTPLNNFFEIYFTTLVNAERFGYNGQLTYHHKDLLKLLQLPFSQIIFTREVCNTIKKHIVKNNWAFINKEKLDWVNGQLNTPFVTTVEISNILKQCSLYIELGKKYYLANKTEKDKVTIELEYLFQFAKLFKQIVTLTTKYPFVENVKGFYSIYHQILSSFTIELYGEPLRGLQVLGMLETRNIDFKNIVLLSANEGTLPAGKTFNSFIPFDIKRVYDLPTHVEKDAVYAYHFYRLIQNAENVTILHNTQTNEFGSGEQSRFVTQIENELPKFNSNISITKRLISYPTIDKVLTEPKVQKTAAIVKKIKERFLSGFSPSALSTYVECPLDFYYKYVLGVGDPDEVEETIEMKTFGTFVHDSLEVLYKPFENKNITEYDLKVLLKNVETTVFAVFAEHYNERELKTGKNLLTLNVAQNYVSTFIKNELALIKGKPDDLYINVLEKELNGEVIVGNERVKLKGKADRIDTYKGQLRVIDYKTGLVEPGDLKIKSTEELLESKRGKAFQLMMYALMYSKTNSLPELGLHSGIISFRKLSSGFMPFTLDKNKTIDSELLLEFEAVLVELIENIYDETKCFEHQHDAKWCKFCQ